MSPQSGWFPRYSSESSSIVATNGERFTRVRLTVRLQAAFGLRREEAMACRFVCSRAFMNIVYSAKY